MNIKGIIYHGVEQLKADKNLAGKLYRRKAAVSKFESLLRCKSYFPKSDIPALGYVEVMSKIYRDMPINDSNAFVYPYTPYLNRVKPYNEQEIVSNTPDWGKVLESDLNEILSSLQACNNQSFAFIETQLLNSIKELAYKISKSKHKCASMFPAILGRRPESLYEAIQKLLFYNAIIWQAGHRHIGLGRLDVVLYPYFNKDIKRGAIDINRTKELLQTFLLLLGIDTGVKSQSLIGDTGQYIMLGGIDANEENVDNELTVLFLEIFSELNIPDPKLILRVNKDTKKEIWELAVKCLKKGHGSPLFINEEKVMKNMKGFGYNEDDIVNFGTSACWEPLIIGESFDQNNPLPSIRCIEPLIDLLNDCKSYKSFDGLISDYENRLSTYICNNVHDIQFDCSPLYSLFFDDCIEREKDFTQGGARYSYHGIQLVSFPNTINALLNLKKLVFDDASFQLSDCRDAMAKNFEGYSDLIALIKQNKLCYGNPDKEVLMLTNRLIHFVGKVCDNITINGNRVKVGFSSPAYISDCKNTAACMDGRKKGEPFAVHISPVSQKLDLLEIVDFASQLQYNDNCMNGNVVDFIIPPSYLNNIEKFATIIKNAFDKGVYEMQLNVLDKATLVDAKAHPEKYPNLIVRVWGFSAYFNDLPEEYKDNLIKRAECYED